MSASNPISINGDLRHREVQERAVSQRIPHHPANEPVPLSFSQQQMWLHSRMANDIYTIPIYNETVTIVREGTLDVVVLERCLAEIVRRHEILRTTFDSNQGQPFQVVQAPSDRFPWRSAESADGVRSIDLLHLSPPERSEEARCVAEEDARTPFFDLKK